MKLKKEKYNDEEINNSVTRIIFIPETEEEKCLMGTLRNHYFFGMDEDGTFPKYDGITSEDNYVTSMAFKFLDFKQK